MGLNNNGGGLDSYTNQELLDQIKQLNDLIEELKEKKNEEDLLKFPWLGNLGHWYWNIELDKVICNDKKVLALDYTKDEIPSEIGFEFFTSKLHPDDYERVMENMRQHLMGNTESYDVEYRIQGKYGDWKWYHDIGKVTKRDKNKKAALIAGIVFDITESKTMEIKIKTQNEKLLEMVNFDYITKLFNRRSVLEKLEEQIYLTNIIEKDISIAILDIDKFKDINYSYGRLAGDEILKRISEIIKENISKKDIAGRYGGGEFLLIFPESSPQQALLLADKIRADIEEEIFIQNIKLTISGGISRYEKELIRDLLQKADANLSKAKISGRNKIVYDE